MKSLKVATTFKHRNTFVQGFLSRIIKKQGPNTVIITVLGMEVGMEIRFSIRGYFLIYLIKKLFYFN